jgi:chromate transporter
MLAAYRADGAVAAVVAGIGCVLPSLVILCVVAVFYNAFVTNPYVRGALRGVSGAVIALFIRSLIKMIKSGLVDVYTVVIFVAAAVLIFVFPSLNVIFIILGGGIVGFVLYYVILRRGRGPNIDG